MWLALLGYLLYCCGLEQNPQYLQGYACTFWLNLSKMSLIASVSFFEEPIARILACMDSWIKPRSWSNNQWLAWGLGGCINWKGEGSKPSLSIGTESGGISRVPYSESKPAPEGVERHKFVVLCGICVNRVKLTVELELSTTHVEKFLRQDSLALALNSKA